MIKIRIICKQIVLFLLCNLLFFIVIAQENNDLLEKDTLSFYPIENDSIDLSSATFITDLEFIPAYELYQKEWNTEHIRVHKLLIPYVNDTLKINLNSEHSQFVYPVKSGEVCSPYGYRSRRMHTGTDIKQNLNDSIFSCFDGVVRMAKVYSGYGKLVLVRHYNGLETVYAHLNKILVKPNQVVRAGEIVGLAGRTGRATTEHLHFEVRFLYEHINPALLLNFDAKTLASDTLLLINSDKNGQNIANSDTSTEKNVNFHIVKKGDTLYAISRKYKVPLKKLLELNKIDENAILSIGQKIKLK